MRNYRRPTVVHRDHKRPATARWIGRPVNEQWLEDRIGRFDLLAAVSASQEMHTPLPIMGTGAYLYKGDVYIGELVHTGQPNRREGLTVGLADRVADWFASGIRPRMVAHAAGFSGVSDLISELTVGGKGQEYYFNKVGVAGVAGRASTLWYASGNPGVGATAAALAGGTDHTKATAGAIGPQSNAAGGDTLHLIGAEISISVAAMGLLLYDRIWAGEPATTTATAQTVTMTPARYATTGAAGTSIGNMAHAEVRATLGAATPTCTLQYVDDAGNAAESAPTFTGITAAAAPTFPYGSATVVPNWFIPLNAGDRGISDITQWTHNASWVSGNFALVLGHPLMYLPGVLLANTGYVRDNVNQPIALPRIYDDACLALLEPPKGATTATTFLGSVKLASG